MASTPSHGVSTFACRPWTVISISSLPGQLIADAIADLAGFELREEVRAENHLRTGIAAQHARIDELQCSVLLSRWRTFLARLEDEHDRAGQLIPYLHED